LPKLLKFFGFWPIRRNNNRAWYLAEWPRCPACLVLNDWRVKWLFL
jgi:hypothetical protein